jgi:hypothetical protein
MIRAGFVAGAVLALLCAAAVAAAGGPAVPPGTASSRRALLDGTAKKEPWLGIHPYPYDAYDRVTPAGRAPRGARAGGDPNPVPGLVNPDVPVINLTDGKDKPPKSATMEGKCCGRGEALARTGRT